MKTRIHTSVKNESGPLKYILNPEGYAVRRSSGDYSYNYYLKDHLGNNRVVLEIDKVNSLVNQATDYYPFGMPYADSQYPERQPYKFGGKEYDEMHGLNRYDFHARHLGTAVPIFTTPDPLAEKYYSVSPYAYCLNNPVKYIDPYGMDAIYDPYGNFLGTDDKGIGSGYLILEKKNFTQGMAHADAQKVLWSGEMSEEAHMRMDKHVAGLSSRPDYDGFVDVSEGIAWAKEHPGALDNPTPDNTLYIDASKLDFGKLNVSNIGLKEGDKENINLFDYVNWASYNSRMSTYALGNTQIQLLDATKGTIKLFTDSYDWDYHNSFANGKPQGTRDNLIYLERKRAGLNDAHGFPLVIYGIGRIKTK